MRLEVAFCAALMLTACRRTADRFRVDSQVLRSKDGLLTVTLRVLDSSAKAVDGAGIELEGDMTHAGMTPVFGTAKALGEGRYRGTLQLTMPGDWVILIHGRLADGNKIEREIVVR